MKYGPTLVTAANYPIARKPAFGGEKTVYLTTDDAMEIGEFEITALNSGVWTADAVNTIPAAGGYLVAVVSSPTGMSGGSANVVLTVAGTNELSASVSATATFQPPGYAENSLKEFQVGYAVDCELSADKKWVTAAVTGVTCQADAIGATIKLILMPDPSRFKEIGCTNDFDFTTLSQVPKAIPCGMNGAAFTKLGRSEQPTITISGKLKGFGDGLTRFDGRSCTAKISIKKEGVLVTDNLYFAGVYLKVKPTYPDGDGEAMVTAEGVFSDQALMVAL